KEEARGRDEPVGKDGARRRRHPRQAATRGGVMRWFGRGDEDYREEIAEHIELETQANIERGMSEDEARRTARVAFGSVAGTRQRLHEGRSGSWASALSQDVRYGLRMIR